MRCQNWSINNAGAICVIGENGSEKNKTSGAPGGCPFQLGSGFLAFLIFSTFLAVSTAHLVLPLNAYCAYCARHMRARLRARLCCVHENFILSFPGWVLRFLSTSYGTARSEQLMLLSIT